MSTNNTKCFFCNDTEDIIMEIGVPFCRDEQACLARQKQQAKERAAEREWKVGDAYTVVEHGLRLTGKIIKIDSDGYHVRWTDGRQTVESKPDPALSRMRG
jgi:hypothetical protein